MKHERNGHQSESERQESALSRLVGKRVVTIGGGSGPFGVLNSMKRYPCSISAIVSMADSGGSSRRLMDEFGVLPLGDLRQALVALSRNGRLWRDVFNFRFPQGAFANGTDKFNTGAFPAVNGQSGQSGQSGQEQTPGVGGHNLGNLIISALQGINRGDLLHAIEDAEALLDTAGRVWPVTLSRVTLCAELADGDEICGETNIDTRGYHATESLASIQRVYLESDEGEAVPCQQAIRAIERADVIVIGPGDLYTSILPNLLVEGVSAAIRASEAEKIYVCNLMTKHGETDGYKASDFVREVHRYLGGPVDRVILHDGSFPPHLVDAYAAEAQYPVQPDVEVVRAMVSEVIVEKLMQVHSDSLIRHDASRLMGAIFAPPARVL
jgi:uncharacterized cofD-like protein